MHDFLYFLSFLTVVTVSFFNNLDSVSDRPYRKLPEVEPVLMPGFTTVFKDCSNSHYYGVNAMAGLQAK